MRFCILGSSIAKLHDVKIKTHVTSGTNMWLEEYSNA
jgi:hypothetical protein